MFSSSHSSLARLLKAKGKEGEKKFSGLILVSPFSSPSTSFRAIYSSNDERRIESANGPEINASAEAESGSHYRLN